MADRPLIGVTGPARHFRVGWWATRLILAISGASACYLTAKQPHFSRPLNGLIIGGGDDIHPKHYGIGSEANARYDPQRDHFELNMAKRAIDVGIPLLGICRGAQLINIALGGTLHQDIRPRYAGASLRNSILPIYRIRINKNSLLALLIKTTSCRVNNLHHQAVDRCGKGLTTVAHDEHGIVEGIESSQTPFLLGVQWHPEYLPYRSEQRKLFSGFVEAARAFNGHLRP